MVCMIFRFRPTSREAGNGGMARLKWLYRDYVVGFRA